VKVVERLLAGDGHDQILPIRGLRRFVA
jgi:hypothetical protein